MHVMQEWGGCSERMRDSYFKCVKRFARDFRQCLLSIAVLVYK